MKNGYKQCPYCGEEIRETAKKCRYCYEFLDEETDSRNNEKKEYKCNWCGKLVKVGEKTCPGCGASGKTLSGIEDKEEYVGIIQEDDPLVEEVNVTSKRKELTIYDLPNEWNELNERQKEVLIKNYPLRGWYKVSVFLIPGFFLLYARRGGLWVLLFLLSFIPMLNVIVGFIARIIICIYWESICYSDSAVNMKKTLLEYEDKWNKRSKNYDGSEIVGYIKKGWLVLTVFVIVITIILVIALIYNSLY